MQTKEFSTFQVLIKYHEHVPNWLMFERFRYELYPNQHKLHYK